MALWLIILFSSWMNYCIQYLCNSFSRINISTKVDMKRLFWFVEIYVLSNLLQNIYASQKIIPSFDYHDQPSHHPIQHPTMTTTAALRFVNILFNMLLGVQQFYSNPLQIYFNLIIWDLGWDFSCPKLLESKKILLEQNPEIPGPATPKVPVVDNYSLQYLLII